MATECLNKVTIECTEEESKGIREALTGRDAIFKMKIFFDFNKMIPIPIELAAKELDADGKFKGFDPEAEAWRMKHWGSNITGHGTEVSYNEGILEFNFSTSTQPEAVIEKLSQFYPTHTITHYYLEREFEFYGAVRYEGGKAVKTNILHFRKICAMFGFNKFIEYNYTPDDENE